MFHKHRWEIIGINCYRDPDSQETWTLYHLQCNQCGELKSQRLDGTVEYFNQEVTND